MNRLQKHQSMINRADHTVCVHLYNFWMIDVPRESAGIFRLICRAREIGSIEHFCFWSEKSSRMNEIATPVHSHPDIYILHAIWQGKRRRKFTHSLFFLVFERRWRWSFIHSFIQLMIDWLYQICSKIQKQSSTPHATVGGTTESPSSGGGSGGPEWVFKIY